MYNPRMRRLFLTAALLFGCVQVAHAETPRTLVYTFGHHILQIGMAAHPEWKNSEEVWLYKGMEAVPPAEFLTCGDDMPLPAGWSKGTSSGWNEEAIALTLQKDIAAKLDRSAGSVTIGRTASGTIIFDGSGLTGQEVDIRAATKLTLAALMQGVSTINLPVNITQPTITVTDPDLAASGIKEVVMIGESVFAGSPVNRRHNIDVGVRKFSGHIIPKDSIFSFVEVLGPVNAATGYRKELVIQGDTTLPDYGGGLCQVSSTAYRGPWEYGLPIVQRKNHSYAVTYYSPQGTDATIYPPSVDMKFLNDTPGDLLIQSFVDEKDRAYFVYYGTKDDRKADVFGPYITGRSSAPAGERTLYTTEIPPGTRRKAGERHDGMKVSWYRNIVKNNEQQPIERFFSSYQARALTYQIGVTAEELARMRGAGAETMGTEVPSWIGTNP
jgi:vancomycin resistance protein YoaR